MFSEKCVCFYLVVFIMLVNCSYARFFEESPKSTKQEQLSTYHTGNMPSDPTRSFSLVPNSVQSSDNRLRVKGRPYSNGKPGCSPTNVHRASSIAMKAAQEAKAAQDAQNLAGQQASHQVKLQLAERAMQAAKAAEAALAGKQAVVEQLEQEVREAEIVCQEQSSSLQQAQANVNAAVLSAQQAAAQLKALKSAYQCAQANVGNAEQAAEGAQQDLLEKSQILEAARARVNQLTKKLNAARIDCSNTRQAAYRAAQAAHDAKLNAERNRRMLRVRQEEN